MSWRYRLYSDVFPLAALVAIECNLVAINTLFKAATLQGMSYYVYVFYSYAVSTLVLIIPLPFIFRRNRAVIPSSKFPLVSRIVLLGLIGALGDTLGFKGIDYSSPTLDSAISNLLPVFTFALAVIFRMEKVVLSSSSAQAKIIGSIVSVSGAMVMTLYKGPIVLSIQTGTQLISVQQTSGSSQSIWLIGSLLITTEYLLCSLWYIIQTQVMKIYPAELVVVFFYYLCGTIILAPVCFMAENNLNAWRLGPDIKSVAVIYSGLFGYSLTTFVQTWALRLKGPVYVATFKPLSIAIAAIMGFIFLGDALYLGSIIGAVIISVGFYAVLWGKAQEQEAIEECDFSGLAPSSSDDKMPLLRSH